VLQALRQVTPKEIRGILMAVENDDLGGPEVVAGSNPWDDLAAKPRIRSEEPECDQTVGLATTHRLGQVEGTVFRSAGKPIKAAFDQPFQAVGKVVPPKEFASVHPVGSEILNLGHLLDQAVARDDGARLTKLLDRLDRHERLE
jgi:hypothetical protein